MVPELIKASNCRRSSPLLPTTTAGSQSPPVQADDHQDHGGEVEAEGAEEGEGLARQAAGQPEADEAPNHLHNRRVTYRSMYSTYKDEKQPYKKMLHPFCCDGRGIQCLPKRKVPKSKG